MNHATRIAVPIIAVLLSITASASTPSPSDPGQSATTSVQDTVDVQHVMDAFHQAVVTHDGARLVSLFIPEGSVWLNVLSDHAYTLAKTKTPSALKVRSSNYKDFAKFVSTTKNSLDPQHTNVQVHSDGTIASVYFDFTFLINGKEENRGSETWQLVKGDQGWRIAAITYSSDPHVL